MEWLQAEGTDSMFTYAKNVAIPNFSSKSELHGFRLTLFVHVHHGIKKIICIVKGKSLYKFLNFLCTLSVIRLILLAYSVKNK